MIIPSKLGRGFGDSNVGDKYVWIILHVYL